MSHWTEEYLSMVADCEQRESLLSAWEQSFVASIRSRLEREITLTAKQIDALDSIWERVTSQQMTH